MIAGLMYAVSYWIQRGPVGGEKLPPVGAGAGDTGGANALGEARRRAHQDRATSPPVSEPTDADPPAPGQPDAPPDADEPPDNDD